jgi:hypothetical protein
MFRTDAISAVTAPDAAPHDPGQLVSAAEVLAALSRALDLTEGQPLGHSIRACLIGMRLGEEAGLGDEALAQLYYALLLKDAGCSSNAARMAALFGSDDQAVKPRLKSVDWDDRMRLAVAAWGERHARSLCRGWATSTRSRQEHVTRAHSCALRAQRRHREAARLPRTVEGIRSLGEHWNGKETPREAW